MVEDTLMRSSNTRALVAVAAAALALFIAGAALAQDKPTADVDAKGKELAQKVCTIFMGGDRSGFEAMLHSSLNKAQNMRYWWDVSGKGGDYTKLYSACELARVDKSSTPERIKVFIQRTPKRPGTSMPAPVSFQPDPKAGGDYKITACSI
jgi:hypothetical protein